MLVTIPATAALKVSVSNCIIVSDFSRCKKTECRDDAPENELVPESGLVRKQYDMCI